jgi:hypothetical protein
MKKVFFACVLIALFVITLNMGIALAADPDLKVTELLVTDTGATGIKIFITDVTRNIGTAEASETITRYSLRPRSSELCEGSTDMGYSGKVVLSKRIVPELSAGEANMGTNYVKIPKKAVLLGNGWPVPGCYYVIVEADALKYVTETNEGNNKRKSLIYIHELQ